MRPPEQLVHSRACASGRFAMFPLEGYPPSRLPSWPGAEVRILAAPAMGAGFAQYLIDLPGGGSGQFAADERIETFYFVLSGTGRFHGVAEPISAGSFGLTPPRASAHFSADAGQGLRLIIVRKQFEPASGIAPFKPIHGHESRVAREVWSGNPHSLLQTLVPDELAFDLAMNIFTFDPGCGLPVVETHVMEHGLFFLQGKGMYYLDGHWMEVEKDDFIWMGPYCPQSFYATGPAPSRYIYYKNVNRDVTL